MFVWAVSLVGFDAGYLAGGGPAAPIWLAGAVAQHPAVTAGRHHGRGRDGNVATWPDRVATAARADDLGTDVSRRVRLTWGCGGDFEWRESGTGSTRLTADTVEICGRHDVPGPVVRVTVRARRLILNAVDLVTANDGFVDVRARELTLNGESRLESRAPRSTQPPFVAAANISFSAESIDGAGHLYVETFGADYEAE